MATKYQVGIPLGDVNGTYIDSTSLQEAMETLAADGLTHNPGQDTIYKSGAYQLQMENLFWLIADIDISQAETNFNNFISGYTFAIAPYAHYWPVN